MMKRLTITYLLLWVTVASGADSLKVSTVTITGLHRTNRWVVQRELRFEIGDTISAENLLAARRRVQNLSLFSDVRLEADSLGHVRMELNELWPVFPLIWAEFSEGQFADVVSKPSTFFDKVTLFTGVAHLNVGGDAGKMYTVAQLGAEQGFQIGYTTRWFSERLPIAVKAEFENVESSDRHASLFDSSRSMRNVRYELNVSTRQGAPSRIGLLLKYHGVWQEKNWPAQGRRDRTTWFSPYAVIDRRDLEWYPSRGSYASVRVDLVSGTPFFTRSLYDLRGYYPLNKRPRSPVFAARFYAGTSSDGTPAWAHYFSGFNSGFRGYLTEKAEFSNYLMGSAEFRIPITEESTYDLPFFGRYGKRLPWGISGLLGIERAELAYGGRRLERLGYAAGLYIRVPYVEILEASVTWNRDGNHEFYLGTGVHF